MQRRILELVILLLICAPVHAQLLIESLDGPVTQNEIDAFKHYMPTVEIRGDNNHNNMVYGRAGNAAEALGAMYEITQDRQILDQLITVADKMLAGRNDPDKGKLIWTGKRDPIWPNRVDAPEPQGGSTEQGDVLAHITLAAKCILQTKSIWNEKLAGDETYLDHAKKLISECDKTEDVFIIPWLVDKQTNLYVWPTSDLWAKQGDREANAQGKPVPWNQQSMLNGGFQRLAECHEILGDDPDRIAKYDAIVRASCEDFLAEQVHYDVDGHDCVKWSYAKEGKTLKHVEDTPHGGYDMLIVRTYRSGRYGIKPESMLTLANTVMYVINKGDGKFAARVDGSGNTRGYLGATYLPLAQFLPELYPVLAKPALSRAKNDPLLTAMILWVKHYRNAGKFP
jgi:hypothetical protein